MSLLLNGSRILRAVEGSLPPAAEERLRAHLRRCARCRERYDNLSLTAEALALAAGRSPTVAATRSRARLLAALIASPNGAPVALPATTRAAPAAVGPGRRTWVVWIPAAALGAAALVMMLVRPGLPRSPRGSSGVPDQVSSEIHWRGAATSDTHDAPQPKAASTLLIYAARKQSDGRAGPVRLVAELPGSSDARVSLTEYLAFGVDHLRTSAFVTIVGIEDGEGAPVHFYLPRPPDEPSRADPNTGLVVFRPSIDLAVSHHPGRLRIYALFSQAPLDAALVKRAAAHLVRSATGAPPLDVPVSQVSGVLMVGP